MSDATDDATVAGAPDACDGCGYRGRPIGRHAYGISGTVLGLCEVCDAVGMANSLLYPRAYPDRHQVRALAWCTNRVLDAVERRAAPLSPDP